MKSQKRECIIRDCVLSRSLLSMIFTVLKDLQVPGKIRVLNGIAYWVGASLRGFTVTTGIQLVQDHFFLKKFIKSCLL